MSASSWTALRSTIASISRWSGVSGSPPASVSSPRKPFIDVSGVRSSCDTEATKLVLSSSSSRRRATISSIRSAIALNEARGAGRLRDAADARAAREVALADLPRGIGELGHGPHDPRLQPAPERERAREHEHRPSPIAARPSTPATRAGRARRAGAPALPGHLRHERRTRSMRRLPCPESNSASAAAVAAAAQGDRARSAKFARQSDTTIAPSAASAGCWAAGSPSAAGEIALDRRPAPARRARGNSARA